MDLGDIPEGAIVVGIDGSPYSHRAWEWALGQAVLDRRPLVLVQVIPGQVNGAGGGAEPLVIPSNADRREAIGRELQSLRHAAASHHPGLVVDTVLAQGRPAEVLIAASRRAATLVVGSHGRGPIGRRLFGSVSLAVVRMARCPTVVVRSEDHAQGAHGVVVGVDGTRGSAAAVEFGYRQASLRGEPLTVLHAFWDADSRKGHPHVVSLDDPRQQDRRALLSEAVAGFSERFPDVETRFALARGLFDECLVEASIGAALIVAGTHPGNPVLDVLFGEVSRALVERSHAAVAVVPDALPRPEGPA